MEELLQQIMNKLGSMESDIKDIKLNMGKDIQDMKTDMTGLKTDMTGLKTDMTDMKADIKDIKHKVTAISDQTADLTEFRTETKAALADLSDKMISVQMDVNNLTAKVANSDNKILEFSKYIKNAK